VRANILKILPYSFVCMENFLTPGIADMTTDLDNFNDVLTDLKNGKQIILVDDKHRENEGDLVILTHFATPENISFMINQGRGLICAVISLERSRSLEIPLQTSVNRSSFNTPFGVSVDLEAVTRIGVSSTSRSETIQALGNPEVGASSFKSPGHVFPLIAHPKGVMGRRGQTEGSYDLARILGVPCPSAVICEVLSDDGTMMRGKDLRRYSDQHGLKITSVESVFQYRLSNEPFFQMTAHASRTISDAQFEIYVFEDEIDGCEHLALVHNTGDGRGARRPIVRLHSECLTGDLFGSRRCDCGGQLQSGLAQVIERGSGVVIYLRQEGRGIGLANKIRAYDLQDAGLDTVDANTRLGLEVDARDYRIAGKILKMLKFDNFDLLTNNPDKLEALKRSGFSGIERIALQVPVDEFNLEYLEAKKGRMGHYL
jgi:3,4-dihydroxy 2-butanone 4-phosphate synthase/GTP cyclohydrolase II